jgi:hypothetical protein
MTEHTEEYKGFTIMVYRAGSFSEWTASATTENPSIQEKLPSLDFHATEFG